jgi:hypothetical protein
MFESGLLPLLFATDSSTVKWGKRSPKLGLRAQANLAQGEPTQEAEASLQRFDSADTAQQAEHGHSCWAPEHSTGSPNP